jgi:phosphatidate cytidylyltransferase
VARSNLTVRLLTSAVAVPLLLCLLYRGPIIGWALLIFVAIVAAAQELYAMAAPGHRFAQVAGIVLTCVVSATLYFATRDARALLTLGIAVPLVGFMVPLWRVKDIAGSGLRLMTLVAGPWYIGALLTTTSLLRRDFGAGWVLLVLSIAWLADTGGYFVGRKLGGAKLYPAVSPNKTWAGLYGALGGGTLAGAAASLGYLPSLPLGHGLLLGLFGGAIGQLGDLVESLLKRSVGAKDSGFIIPGHGGILDRIDAVLFVAPTTYLYAIWFASPQH